MIDIFLVRLRSNFITCLDLIIYVNINNNRMHFFLSCMQVYDVLHNLLLHDIVLVNDITRSRNTQVCAMFQILSLMMIQQRYKCKLHVTLVTLSFFILHTRLYFGFGDNLPSPVPGGISQASTVPATDAEALENARRGVAEARAQEATALPSPESAGSGQKRSCCPRGKCPGLANTTRQDQKARHNATCSA